MFLPSICNKKRHQKLKLFQAFPLMTLNIIEYLVSRVSLYLKRGDKISCRMTLFGLNRKLNESLTHEVSKLGEMQDFICQLF